MHKTIHSEWKEFRKKTTENSENSFLDLVSSAVACDDTFASGGDRTKPRIESAESLASGAQAKPKGGAENRRKARKLERVGSKGD
jgi:hypothetical protein